MPPTQTFLGVRHMFLTHKRLLKREGKNVDQLQHTSDLGSALWTLRNSSQDFRKDQKGLTFRTNYSVNSPTFVPREIIQPLSPTFLSGENSLVTYSNCITLCAELVRRVWLVNTLTSTVPIGSPIVTIELQLTFANNGKEI